MDKVLEGILLLAIQEAQQMELTNKNKEDLEETIEKVSIEGRLSLKQIDTIKVAQGRKY